MSIMSDDKREKTPKTNAASSSVEGKADDAEEKKDSNYSNDEQYKGATASTTTSSGKTLSSKRKKRRKQQTEIEVYEPGPVLNLLYKCFGRDEKKDDSVPDMEWIGDLVNQDKTHIPIKENMTKRKRRRPKRIKNETEGKTDMQEENRENGSSSSESPTNFDSDATVDRGYDDVVLVKQQQDSSGREIESDTESVKSEKRKKRKIRRKTKSRRLQAEVIYERFNENSHKLQTKHPLSDEQKFYNNPSRNEDEFNCEHNTDSWVDDSTNTEDTLESTSDSETEDSDTVFDKSCKRYDCKTGNKQSDENLLENDFLSEGIQLSSRYMSQFENKSKDDYCFYSMEESVSIATREMWKRKPDQYVRCHIELLASHRAICTPVNSASDTKKIEIRGRSKCGQTFSEDEVMIKILSRESENENLKSSAECQDSKVYGQVVAILERNRFAHVDHPVFICVLDEFEGHLMVPICKTVPKLHIFSGKVKKKYPSQKRNKIEVYRYKETNGTLSFKEYCNIKEEDRNHYRFLVCYINWERRNIYPFGAVIGVLRSSAHNINTGLKVLSIQYQTPYLYKEATVRSVEQMLCEMPEEPTTSFIRERIDLSDSLTVFAIDPPGSKDIDDALSIESLDNGLVQVGIHIADVSSHIQKGGPVDLEAKERCTTFYSSHKNKAFHLLPEPLSQDLLSLRAGKRRAALSVFFKMDYQGRLIDRGEIKRTLVRSSGQFTYKEIQDILFQNSSIADEYLLEDIKKLFSLATHLRKRRLGNQMYAFRTESQFADGDNIEQDTSEAHYLVEEFMILTNFMIADFLIRHYPKSVPLRCQNFPDKDKLVNWLDKHNHIADIIFLLQNIRLGYKEHPVVDMNNLPSVIRFTRLIPLQTKIWNQIKEAIDENDLEKVKCVVGSDEQHPSQCVAFWEWVAFQETAKYRCSGAFDEPQKESLHFALGISPYTHFTSPIRRYVDVTVHRLVHAVLNGDSEAPYSSDEVEEICCHINVVAKRAKLYQKQCQVLSMAHKLKSNPLRINAFVDDCSDKGVTVRIPGLRNVQKQHREISFNLLDVCKIPIIRNDFDLVRDSNTLRQMVEVQWQKRLYNFRKQTTFMEREENRVCHELDPHKHTSFLRLSDWRDILCSLVENNPENLYKTVNQIKGEVDRHDLKNFVLSCRKRVNDVSSEVKNGLITNHLVNFKIPFHLTQVLSIQLTAEAEKGIFVPYIQHVDITDNVSFCLQHMDNPVKYLAKYAVVPAKSNYNSVSEYLSTWLPIINMESATNAVRNEDSATINNIPITFRGRQGMFTLPVSFCDERDIDFGSMQTTVLSIEEERSLWETTDAENCEDDDFKPLASSNFLCIRHKNDERYWIAHGEMNKLRKKKKTIAGRGCRKINTYECSFKLHTLSTPPPVKETGESKEYCMEILMKAKVDRRMESVLKLLTHNEIGPLSRAIALGENIPNTDAIHRSIEKDMPRDVFLPGLEVARNNPLQDKAINKALHSRFSLIQGPPGTGKTYTGVKLIYLFNLFNDRMAERSGGMKNKIIFCGPSNKSVDLVASWMLSKFGNNAPRMVRMYGQAYELLDFPVPGRVGVSKRSTRDSKPEKILVENNVVLHFLIRNEGKPFAEQLRQFDEKFRTRPNDVTLQDVKDYFKILSKATIEELKNYDVIFCTTSLTANPKLLKGTQGRIYQCIIDECGMCTEPETMVPIIATRAKQVVLIGDHKQLQPIIICRNASDMGLKNSLFERYANMGSKFFTMLTAQYRMNPHICVFPSKTFYDGKLTTEPSLCWEVEVPLRLWGNRDPLNHIPFAFLHVEGVEETLTVTTEEGNEKSKSNKAEVKAVVKLFSYLVEKEKVNPEYIQILSQYNAQRHMIQEELKESKYINIKVNTVVASQGGEWDYVLFSTVRSLPQYLIEPNPTIGWCRQSLGFITDANQVNVALTRAKKGLIIIGNKNLMRCDNIWKKLIRHYEHLGRVFTPDTFPPRPSAVNRRKTKKRGKGIKDTDGRGIVQRYWGVNRSKGIKDTEGRGIVQRYWGVHRSKGIKDTEGRGIVQRYWGVNRSKGIKDTEGRGIVQRYWGVNRSKGIKDTEGRGIVQRYWGVNRSKGIKDTEGRGIVQRYWGVNRSKGIKDTEGRGIVQRYWGVNRSKGIKDTEGRGIVKRYWGVNRSKGIKDTEGRGIVQRYWGREQE